MSKLGSAHFSTANAPLYLLLSKTFR